MEVRSAATMFVGRTRELERLDETLSAAAAGRGSTVLITGEAGIGKTRLVSELAARARSTGATVLVGRCIDLLGTALPYLPVAEALRPLGDAAGAAGRSAAAARDRERGGVAAPPVRGSADGARTRRR
jgi:predicted ATPase